MNFGYCLLIERQLFLKSSRTKVYLVAQCSRTNRSLHWCKSSVLWLWKQRVFVSRVLRHSCVLRARLRGRGSVAHSCACGAFKVCELVPVHGVLDALAAHLRAFAVALHCTTWICLSQ